MTKEELRQLRKDGEIIVVDEGLTYERSPYVYHVKTFGYEFGHDMIEVLYFTSIDGDYDSFRDSLDFAFRDLTS